MPKRVQIVLNEDILSLGKNGDLVEVAPGYARNFLLPFGKAVPVTPAVMKQVEHRRAKEAERQAALKQEAIETATKKEIDRRDIVVPEIHRTGKYTVHVKLHSEVTAELNLEVVSY